MIKAGKEERHIRAMDEKTKAKCWWECKRDKLDYDWSTSWVTYNTINNVWEVTPCV